MIKPAIVIIGYKRINSLIRLLNSIENAFYPVNDITLIISIDKSEKQKEIKNIINNFNWEHGEKVVILHSERQGLKKHIISNGNLSLKYGAVIILEDDLFVAPDFYNFIYQAVNFYESCEKIAGIGLYSHEWNGYAHAPFVKRIGEADVFAGQFSITWGQCWTSSRWQDFMNWLSINEEYEYNFYIPERINRWSKQSWGKYFANYIKEKNLYYIIPNISMSTNFSEIGQHNSIINTDHQVSLWLCRNKKYNFKNFESLYKYDLFFEPIFEEEILKISPNLIDIDLNNTKKKRLEKRYLLSTKKENYKVLASYSLDLRPIELNILFNLKGKGIYLYDKTKKVKNKNLVQSKLNYDIRGYNFIQLFYVGFQNFKEIIFIKIKLFLKKLKTKN